MLLRHREAWAVEEFTKLGTHSVTHVDVPWHYNITIRGEPSVTIDRLPLEWFFAEGVVLDMVYKADGEEVQLPDVEAALTAINCTPKPSESCGKIRRLKADGSPDIRGPIHPSSRSAN